jgi:hypothetical protein
MCLLSSPVSGWVCAYMCVCVRMHMWVVTSGRTFDLPRIIRKLKSRFPKVASSHTKFVERETAGGAKQKRTTEEIHKIRNQGGMGHGDGKSRNSCAARKGLETWKLDPVRWPMGCRKRGRLLWISLKKRTMNTHNRLHSTQLTIIDTHHCRLAVFRPAALRGIDWGTEFCRINRSLPFSAYITSWLHQSTSSSSTHHSYLGSKSFLRKQLCYLRG